MTDESKPTDTDQPVIATETRDLACQLTDTERLDRGSRMAAAAEQAAGLKLEAAAISKRARVHALEAGRIAAIVHSGFEMREIKVEWRADYQQRCKTAHRTDTGEALETIALTAAELQLTLDPIAPPTPIHTPARGRGRGRARLTAVPGGASINATQSELASEQSPNNQPALITHHEYGPGSASPPAEASTTSAAPTETPTEPTGA